MTTETPHTAIRLVESACTSCMVCARECPSWCISIGSHPETVTEPGGGRPRTVHVLDHFVLDWALCMYCGICVGTCPFDALEWTSDAVAPGRTLLDLAHGIDALG